MAASNSGNNGADLTFVISTGLRDSRSAANKRKVRSAAALKSWDTRLAGIRKRSECTAGSTRHIKRRQSSGSKAAESSEKSAVEGGNGDAIPSPSSTHSAGTKHDSPLQQAAFLQSPVHRAQRSTWQSPDSTHIAERPAVEHQKLTGRGVKRQHSGAAQQLPTPSPPRPGSSRSTVQITPQLLEQHTDDAHHSAISDPPCRCAVCQAQTSTDELTWALARVEQPPQYVNSFAEQIAIQHNSSTYVYDNGLLTPVSTSATPYRIASGELDPFNCSPVEHKPWFDGILHHMLTVFAPRGWPALKISRSEGLLWERFMTQHALSEPALFYVRLLFATGDLVRLRVCKPEVTYWLQARAIEAINEALADPVRATSDALILAVGRIAFHESMYGDRRAAHAVHRPAQARMIAMRGGLRNLDFPGLVKRLMRWSDRVMSVQGGTERMLPDEEGPSFTVEASVRVLEEWVPPEGQALRKKITISDLLQ